MSVIKFGTDGWRALSAKEFTFENFAVVVQAISNLLARGDLPDQPSDRKEVLIGYDARALARDFAEEAASILAGNGIPAAMVMRPTPTPVVAHAIADRLALGAFMLTASHNPPEYMGVKFIPWYAGPALADITTKIEAEVAVVYESKDIKRDDSVQPEALDPRRAYFDALKYLIDFEAIRDSGLRLAVDPMFGTTMGYLDTALKAAGCDVRTIHATPSPGFGGGLPDPSEDRLGPLMDLVKTEFLDVGLANDGDGDRFGIVDFGGKFIPAGDFISLVTDYHLRDGKVAPGTKVVRTVATTHLIDAVAERYGAQVVETPVGFKWVGDEIRKGALLGGEESGGMTRGDHIPEKDGIFACLLAAEMVAKTGVPLTRQLEMLRSRHAEHRWFRRNLHISPEQRETVMDRFEALGERDQVAGEKVAKVDTRDGVKVWLEDGSWLLGRPSGTEPIVRVYAEARSAERQEALEGLLVELVAP
ncbi:MAG: phosphoglucomutase/phosphomannomutase family protein [Armatimonadia bacterium]|nr:phosphoglucomutase/phosphomannomutase family protein [Armatimonadia bacterium]